MMGVAYFLRHTQTGKKFRVLSRDKEAGTVKLKGSLAEFEEKFDVDRFKRQGYVLEKQELDEDA